MSVSVCVRLRVSVSVRVSGCARVRECARFEGLERSAHRRKVVVPQRVHEEVPGGTHPKWYLEYSLYRCSLVPGVLCRCSRRAAHSDVAWFCACINHTRRRTHARTLTPTHTHTHMHTRRTTHMQAHNTTVQSASEEQRADGTGPIGWLWQAHARVIARRYSHAERIVASVRVAVVQHATCIVARAC